MLERPRAADAGGSRCARGSCSACSCSRRSGSLAGGRRHLCLAALLPARARRRTLEASHPQRRAVALPRGAAAARAAAARAARRPPGVVRSARDERHGARVAAVRLPGRRRPSPPSCPTDSTSPQRATDDGERAATSPSPARAAAAATACAPRSSRGRRTRARHRAPRSTTWTATLRRLLLIEAGRDAGRARGDRARSGSGSSGSGCARWRAIERRPRRSPPATSRSGSSAPRRAPRSAGSGSR